MDDEAETPGPTRKQFLVHIEADVIRQVKILAIERGVRTFAVRFFGSADG